MNLKKRIGSAVVIATLAVLIAPNSASGTKLDCSGSKKSKQEVSAQSIKPGDVPGRELVQVVRIDILSSKNPEFDGMEQTDYIHLDHIAGTGSHNGYNSTTLKSGEKLWVKFEGTHYLVPRAMTSGSFPMLEFFTTSRGLESTRLSVAEATTRER